MVKKAVTSKKTEKPTTKATSTSKKVKKSKTEAVKTVVVTPVNKLSVASLNTWNKWVAFLYLLQAAALVVAGTASSLPVTINYLTKDTFVSKPDENPVLALATRHLFDINLLYLLAGILVVAAIVHILYVTLYRSRYEKELQAEVNRLRWAGYGLVVAGVATVIGLIVGIYDISLLFTLIVLTVLASLAGLAIEVYGQGKNRRRLVYVIGAIATLSPWFVVIATLVSANVFGSGNIPAYVYSTVGSVLALHIVLIGLMHARYKKLGKHTSDYLRAERAYSVLLFVLLTAVTWQVFVGLLRP
jgi:hypothetical protein